MDRNTERGRFNAKYRNSWRYTIMSEYTILPLINASFQPGEAKRTVAGFEDRDFQKI